MEKDQFQIRPRKATDLNFILATFSKSMKIESSLGRSCSAEVFFKGFQKVVDYILERSEILVACEVHDENTILGYLVFEKPDLIHYAYVRPTLHKLNIAKDLIKLAFPEAKSLRFSLSTNSSKEISKKYPELTCDPFPLFKKGA